MMTLPFTVSIVASGVLVNPSSAAGRADAPRAAWASLLALLRERSWLESPPGTRHDPRRGYGNAESRKTRVGEPKYVMEARKRAIAGQESPPRDEVSTKQGFSRSLGPQKAWKWPPGSGSTTIYRSFTIEAPIYSVVFASTNCYDIVKFFSACVNLRIG